MHALNDTQPKLEPVPAVGTSTRAMASPVAAAAFAAGVTYSWLEALWRLLFTYYPTFDADWVLWNGRVGDIAAMWLTISGLSTVVGFALYAAWRRKDHMGAISDWTILLIGSAIAAPMVGEIGNTTGSVAGGGGSTDVVAIIAYIVLGVVAVLGGIALAMVRHPRSGA